MEWDSEDRLREVDLGGGGRAFYVYDSAGQRVRKVIESLSGVRCKERVYLGGFEVYREFDSDGATVELERESMHVMDDARRVALVETLTVEESDEVVGPVSLRRYQLGNHLDSASVELDGEGGLISYEEFHPYGTTAFQAGRSAAEVSCKRYRYTAMERDDESGLAYHSARYYAPWLGRWTAADPGGLVDGVNGYAYVVGRVLQAIDPTGLAGGPTATGGRRSSQGAVDYSRIEDTVVALGHHRAMPAPIIEEAMALSLRPRFSVFRGHPSFADLDTHRVYLTEPVAQRLMRLARWSGAELSSVGEVAGAADSLTHEMTHVYVWANRDQEHVAAVLRRAEAYYMGAPRADGKTVTNPWSPVQEGLAEYAAQRVRVYLETYLTLERLLYRLEHESVDACSAWRDFQSHVTEYEQRLRVEVYPRDNTDPENRSTARRKVSAEMKRFVDVVVLGGQINNRFVDNPDLVYLANEIEEAIARQAQDGVDAQCKPLEPNTCGD